MCVNTQHPFNFVLRRTISGVRIAVHGAYTFILLFINVFFAFVFCSRLLSAHEGAISGPVLLIKGVVTGIDIVGIRSDDGFEPIFPGE